MQCDADEALWFTFRVQRRLWRVILAHHDHDALVDDDHEDGPPLYGVCLLEDGRIYINASGSDRVIQDTAVHEVGHASLTGPDVATLLETELGSDIEEALIRSLTPVLCRVARPRLPPYPPEARALLRVARRKVRR